MVVTLRLVLAALLCWTWNLQAAPQRLTSVHALLQPDGLPPSSREVELAFRWDDTFPGRGGRARYTIAVSPLVGGGPGALLFEGVGNQGLVKVDGMILAMWGTPGDPRTDSGKSPQLVVVPPQLWTSGQAPMVMLETTMQPLRGGGLASMHYGSLAELAPMHARARLAGPVAAAVYGAGLLLMGGLAAGLWWRQRDPLYGCFALMALFGGARYFDRVVQTALLPWPAWGALLAICYGAHIALTARFIVLLLDRPPPSLLRTVDLTLAATLALSMLSFVLLARWPWNAALVALEAMGLATFAVVLHDALIDRRPVVWVVLGAGALLLLAGAHDILRVRLGWLGWLGDTATPLTPHALFFFVLLLAGIVVQRYSNTLAQFRVLSEHLTDLVAERERELRQAFEALRVQQQEQAVMGERQRMMREIHDGIGSQLVSLLGMVEHPATDRQVLQKHVKLALDEMRMAVDALQPVHDDLTLVLATLRYRLQPQLEAAGMQVVWQIDPLPPVAALSPQVVLQLQRILLEAFTNVLKHARAKTITVEGRWREEPPAIVLRLGDDGIGLSMDAGQPTRGNGIANMRSRAESIGARVKIGNGPRGGTTVLVEWPAPHKTGIEKANAAAG